MIFAAEDINLFHLGMVEVEYPPKDIHTMALQVTSDNIGRLSLEFETDLIYNGGHPPYFYIDAARDNEAHGEELRSLCVRITDWIVILWDKIYAFRDAEFKTTFSMCKDFELRSPNAVRRELGYDPLPGGDVEGPTEFQLAARQMMETNRGIGKIDSIELNAEGVEVKGHLNPGEQLPSSVRDDWKAPHPSVESNKQ